MYNGIGLTTPRGSGTNGYVVRNLSSIQQRRREPVKPFHELEEEHRERFRERKPNEEILLHERKREVELKCMTLQLTLEEDGVPEAEVEEKVGELRQRLLKDLDQVQLKNAKLLKEHETHQLQKAKEEENVRMQAALGVSTEYVEGQAFDRELQERLRQERREAREARERERE
ncbi:hypothetical protein THASP1DRAFT_2832, partial [Thamnocephalis sphaerospora]